MGKSPALSLWSPKICALQSRCVFCTACSSHPFAYYMVGSSRLPFICFSILIKQLAEACSLYQNCWSTLLRSTGVLASPGSFRLGSELASYSSRSGTIPVKGGRLLSTAPAKVNANFLQTKVLFIAQMST